ncbi:hypothetical protein [Aneurinibacillus tyrosinisolvens]|uniref:hypothetical protein n=1 Tax=Aneurinibacillus tyrosinisolvens TaxID=1443435 RepID=UPI00063F962D|nr:hypothetical protein [Aneurinibacillus tyrosinisolvens]
MKYGDLQILKNKLYDEMSEAMNSYLEQTNQKDAITSETGQGVFFAFGIAMGIISKVFKEEADRLSDTK